jgi:subfamily B ATP-binding cassette protein HlyB/CyaB
MVFNKLVYFSYIRDTYGFKDEKSEKSFLKDLLFSQHVVLPDQFRQLNIENKKIKLVAPLVLSVKEVPEEKLTYNVPIQEPGIYTRLFRQLGANKGIWYIYLVTVLFAASLSQLTVFVNQVLIDHVLPSFQLNILTLFAVGFALFRIFNLMISQYKHFVSIHVGNILDNYFLSSFNEKLNNFSLRYAQSFKKGDLTERLSDAMKLKSFFLRIFSSILVDAFVSLFSISVLLYINWQLTLLICAVVFLYAAWFKFVTPYLQFNEQKRFIIKGDFFSRMIERIDGNQVIKCFGVAETFTNRIQRNIKDLIDIQTKTKYIDLFNSALTSIISTVAFTLIVIFLARNAISAQSPLSFGQLITFIMLSERVFSAFNGILGENLTLRENEIILRRYFDFNEPSTKDGPNDGIRDFTISDLILNKISFGYNPSIPVLKNVDFRVSKGEKIRIEGGNGSGKSSLSKIISFLYDADAGDIVVNGMKCTFYDRKSLRDKILLISNEDVLFNDSILFNVAFNRKISHATIIELAKEIGLYDFIASHEEGLSFTISENGRNLSTGQRKKILVMRALLSRAEIVILDEVLSGIDLLSRERIERLIESTDSRAFILISHEPVKNMKFDRNFTLSNGELVYAEY